MSDKTQPQIARFFFESPIFAHSGEELEPKAPIVLKRKFPAGDYLLTIAYETERENSLVPPTHPNVVFSLKGKAEKPEQMSLSAREHFSAFSTIFSGGPGKPLPTIDPGKQEEEIRKLIEKMKEWVAINEASIKFLGEIYVIVAGSVARDLNLRLQIPDSSDPKFRM